MNTNCQARTSPSSGSVNVLPTPNRDDDQAADQQRDAAADRDAHVVDAERAPLFLARKRVGNIE